MSRSGTLVRPDRLVGALSSVEPASVPTIAPHGEIRYEGRVVHVSERLALLAAVFVFHYGADLTATELLDRVWPDGASGRTLRVHLRRLGRRLAPLGLQLVEVVDGYWTLKPV